MIYMKNHYNAEPFPIKVIVIAINDFYRKQLLYPLLRQFFSFGKQFGLLRKCCFLVSIFCFVSQDISNAKFMVVSAL